MPRSLRECPRCTLIFYNRRQCGIFLLIGLIMFSIVSNSDETFMLSLVDVDANEEAGML